MKEEFNVMLQSAVQKFRLVNNPIKIITHNDADGISSAIILSEALRREGILFSLSCIKDLNEKTAEEFANESYKTIFLADLGSGHLSLLQKYCNEKNVFIFDHHIPEETEHNHVHINPLLAGYEGREINAAGVCYFFAKTMSEENKDLSYLALIGAEGDHQLQNPSTLHNEILNDALSTETISEPTRELFSSFDVQVDKLLVTSTNPFIPRVTGNVVGAIEFLKECEVPKEGSLWPKYQDLTEQHKRTIIENICLRRALDENQEDLVKVTYLATKERRTLKELAEIFESCGRDNNAPRALGLYLQNKEDEKQALKCFQEYKRKMIQAIQWYLQNKNAHLKTESLFLVNAHEHLPAEMVRVIANMLEKADTFEQERFIVVMAKENSEQTKVSIRFTGDISETNICLQKIITQLTSFVDGKAGGHKNRAGGYIATAREQEFVEHAKEILAKLALEETV